MSKLYVFGIGGTGSRVLKSLALLLAAGLEMKDTVVPIVIDRDLANADLTRTKEIIDDYINVNKIAPRANELNKNKFFSTEIRLLNNNLYLKLEDNTQVFGEYIHSNTMSNANKALVNTLFADETLQLDMTEGFQGNPNIGSVVLNQFDETEIFKSFAEDFEPGDKIFIISSIFGGTGASGFPLLLKNLRTSKPNMSKWGDIQKAPIGAITILPYFSVSNQKEDKNANSLVDSDTFTDKAKAALSYYESLNKQLDILYYIADKVKSLYKHVKGGAEQKNDAHFIELAAALAIQDFSNQKIISNGSTSYKEFGIEPSKATDASGNVQINDCQEMSFSDLANTTLELIRKPMIQFFIFRKYLKEVFEHERKYQPYARKRFEENFKNKEVISSLENIQDAFYSWLKEMGNQNRKFVPFRMDANNKDPFEFVRDIEKSKKGNFSYKQWAWFDNELNKVDVSTSLIQESQFIEMFYRVSEKFANEIVNR